MLPCACNISPAFTGRQLRYVSGGSDMLAHIVTMVTNGVPTMLTMLMRDSIMLDVVLGSVSFTLNDQPFCQGVFSLTQISNVMLIQ